MYSFDPPEMRQALKEGIEAYKDDVDVDELYFLWEPDVDDEYEDRVFTRDSLISLKLEKFDVSEQLSLGDLIDLLNEVRAASLEGPKAIFRSRTRSIAWIEPCNDAAVEYWARHAWRKVQIETSTSIGSRPVRLSLVYESLPFLLKLTALEPEYDIDHMPEVGGMYLEITYEQYISNDTLDALIMAFLFELSSSHHMDFALRSFPKPIVFSDDGYYGEEMTPTPEFRLRPIDTTSGLPDVYKLFSKAISSNDVEYRLIGLVKVLENISVTLVKHGLHSALRTQLLSSKALAPDARFIENLLKTIKENRIYENDSESLKLTIKTCCNGNELSLCAPTFLKSKAWGFHSSKPMNISLAHFAETLSSTRNQFVHGKANYVKTGKECPAEQLYELEQCARLAAIQAIRWFASQPEHVRVYNDKPL